MFVMNLRLVGCETIKKLGLRRGAEGLYYVRCLCYY